MTDREMLEYAAKAAGMNLGKWKFYEGLSAKFVLMLDGEPTSNWWNPLTNDGDALRLAVKLRLWIQITERCSWAQQDAETILGESAVSSMAMHSETNNDPYAATRLAITRAAAEIGRSME